MRQAVCGLSDVMHLSLWPNPWNYFYRCRSYAESAHQPCRLSPSSLPWLVDRWGAVTNVLFTAIKTSEPASNWADFYGIHTIHAAQTSMNLYWPGAFRSKQFSQHSLPSIYVHNIRHCTATVLKALYLLQHRWPDGAGQRRNPVDTAINSTQRHI